MCDTTSSSPTTARLAASTTVRTPAARRRGPVQPKNSASGPERAQLLHHQRGVKVARRLARRNQNLAAHPDTSLACRPVTIGQRMSTDAEQPKLTVEELAARFRGEMIPLTSKFAYFSTLPMAEDDLRQYLNDPIAAISPAIVAALPSIGIILAPYLEKGNGKERRLGDLRAPAGSPPHPLLPARPEGSHRAGVGHQGNRGGRLSLPVLQRPRRTAGGPLVRRRCRSASTAPSARS